MKPKILGLLPTNTLNNTCFPFLIPVMLLFIAQCSCVERTRNDASRSPNIVLILADDLGYGDLSCYGATQYNTPNIDQLAVTGMRFTNFYVAQSVCSASRAGLMTGCYANRVGIGGFLLPSSSIGLNPEEETLAELLKKAGYRTAIFGKWHLGHHKQFLPLQQGFDVFYGLPYSNSMWKYNIDGTINEKSKFPPLYLIEGNENREEIKTMEDQARLTTLFTEKAVDFINNNSKRQFFLYLPHPMPHVPIAVSDKFKGKSQQGLYGDVVMELDWSVGKIIQALKRNGIYQNTLVVFTSDNGPWLKYGNHAGSAGGLREGKLTTFEGGQRVPCIMNWPNQIPAGSICNKITSTIDMLPTFAGITGTPLPENEIDGMNILPLLKGDEQADPRQAFAYYFQFDDSIGNLQAVRKGRWKLVLPHKSITNMGCIPGKDGTRGEKKTFETGYLLFDLRRDPGERYDMKENFPEIVQEMKDLAYETREILGDKITGVKGSGLRKPGTINDEKIQ